MLGRLLQRLEQRVEGRGREHVDLVHHEDAVLARRGRVAHRLDELAHVVHAGAAGRVDLAHVRRRPGGDLLARRALGAGLVRGALVAVEAAGQDAGQRGLADAARSGEQQGVRDPAGADRVAQRGRDVGLTRHLVEAARPPFSCQDFVAQQGVVRRVGASRIAGHPRPQLQARYRCFLPDLTGFKANPLR